MVINALFKNPCLPLRGRGRMNINIMRIYMNIRQIKEQYTCLDYLGKPIRKLSSGWYLYRAPYRRDNHPSLNVSPSGKAWFDKATGEKGGIVELVQRCLNTTDFSLICAEFQDSSSFSQSRTFDDEKEKDVSSGFKKFEVVSLQSRGLFAYLHSRKVNIEIAKQFLKEAHYSFKDGDSFLYALAYPNDKGGYELRSSFFKGGTSPKGVTTHRFIDGAPVVIFEGFMDMLSFATLCGGVRHNYIVLNSIVNVDAVLEALACHGEKIYLCLDNDEAGRTATKRMREQLPLAQDISNRFTLYKDVNDYLCSLPK